MNIIESICRGFAALNGCILAHMAMCLRLSCWSFLGPCRGHVMLALLMCGCRLKCRQDKAFSQVACIT